MTRIQRTSTVEPRIVVRGAARPQAVWPEERPLAAAVAERWAAEIGDPWQVIELLALADGVEPTTYLAAHGSDVASIRALTAHCAAAVLQAAVRVGDSLTPSNVLAELHEALGQPIDRRRELAELLAS